MMIVARIVGLMIMSPQNIYINVGNYITGIFIKYINSYWIL